MLLSDKERRKFWKIMVLQKQDNIQNSQEDKHTHTHSVFIAEATEGTVL
jgi:hypothetical protein